MEPHLPALELQERDDSERAMLSDVASLVALVEKIDKQNVHASTGNNEPSETDDAFTRLLQSARAYAAAAKADGVNNFDVSPPQSPTNVLVGVLKRENASLLAKIRRLENDAKRYDDKSAWCEEHTMNRLKNAEVHAAETVAEKNRVEALYAEAISQRKQVEKELAQVVAENKNLGVLMEEATSDKNSIEAHLEQVISEKNRLEKLYTEALAEKCHCAPLWSEANAEKSRLETLHRDAVAEKNQLEAHLTAAIDEKNRLESQYVSVVTEKERLGVFYSNVEAEKARLEGLHAGVEMNKSQLETLYAEAIAEKNHLQAQLMELTEESETLKAQLAEGRARLDRLNMLYSEAVDQKNRVEADLSIERLRREEMERTIAHLRSRLAEAEKAFTDAKANLSGAMSRSKRSGTTETSGTDTDDSDSPSGLSLSDLRIEGDIEKSLTRSTMKNDSPRRRAGVRGRSIISTLIDHHSSGAVDPSQSCSRSRCQSIDINTNKKNQRMRAERASLQTSPPRSAASTTRDHSKSFSRYRSIEPLATPSSSSSQSSQQRPRWRL